jgi:hypothetical protein
MIDEGELISISSKIKNIKQIRSEVCCVPIKEHGGGLIQLMSKADMRSKLKIPSPNMFDVLMMQETDCRSSKKKWGKISYPNMGYL